MEDNSDLAKNQHPSGCTHFMDEDLFGYPPTPLPDCTLPTSNTRPVSIRYFMKVSFTVNMITSFVFARVSWLHPHPDSYIFGKPVELWCHNLFESFGLHSFVPVNQLLRNCARGVKVYHGENLLAVISLVE